MSGWGLDLVIGRVGIALVPKLTGMLCDTVRAGPHEVLVGALAVSGLAASDCGARKGARGWPSTPLGLLVVLDGKLDLVAHGDPMSTPR